MQIKAHWHGCQKELKSGAISKIPGHTQTVKSWPQGIDLAEEADFYKNLIDNLYDGIRSGDFSSGLLFIDSDHFKDFNDKHGHDLGDQILMVVAQTLRSNLRATDSLARWGGEEFIAILPDVPNIQAVNDIAEKLRNLVTHSNIAHHDKFLPVTVSIGGILLDGDETIKGNLERADRLMYQSKQAGRNRVMVEV